MTQKVRIVQEISGSLTIGIPKTIAKELDIKKSDALMVSMKEDKIIVERLK